MLTVYFSSRFDNQALMKQWAETLQTNGYRVACQWLDEVPENDDYVAKPGPLVCKTKKVAKHYDWMARRDMSDILLADTLIHFSDGTFPCGRGGRHIEVGFALGLGKDVVFIGPKDNVFHYLTWPSVSHYETWEEFCKERHIKYEDSGEMDRDL